MEPGSLIYIADNIGDNLSYTVLPVKYWNEIRVHHRLIALVRSVVRIRLIEYPDYPKFVDFPEGLKVYVDILKIFWNRGDGN